MNNKPNAKQIGLLCYLLKSTKIETEVWPGILGGVYQAGIRSILFAKKISVDDLSDLVDSLKTYERTNSLPEYEYIVSKIKKLDI